MRRLHLDFGPGADRPRRPLAWLALVLALGLLAWQAPPLHQALRERTLLLDQLAQLKAARSAIAQAAQPAATGQAAPADHAAVAHAAARLQAPWAALFTGIESAGDAHVVLLALEPDADTGALRIQAEAQAAPALLAYTRRLAELPTLAGAQLASHQVQAQHPQRPVQGDIVARWRVAPPQLPPRPPPDPAQPGSAIALRQAPP